MIPKDIHYQACIAYAQPHRKYHTMTHIAEMYMLATVYHIQLTMVQRYAILFHDIVYEVPAREVSNEELSAQMAEHMLADRGLKESQIKHVAQIIRDTQQELPTIEQSALVIDLDLAGLALNYWKNLDLIREEFGHLSDDEFYPGRLKWLESMLARDKIYVSGWFDHLEKDAVTNITKEIELIRREGKA